MRYAKHWGRDPYSVLAMNVGNNGSVETVFALLQNIPLTISLGCVPSEGTVLIHLSEVGRFEQTCTASVL